MKVILALEETALLTLATYALYLQPISIAWWLWPFLFLAPDIAMIGYAFGKRIGAITYNLFHHKGIALALTAIAYTLDQPVLLLAGLILFAHSAFDRVFGFGLKYDSGFKCTHLDVIK